MSAAPTARVVVVTRHRVVGGVDVRAHVIPTGHRLPHHIARRATVAHRIGLDHVRALGEGGDVVAVTVTDGRRALASWSRMAGLPGFTGTHDVHPAVPIDPRAETLGAVLARRVAAVAR